MSLIVLVVSVVAVLLMAVMWIASRYEKCPSNHVLVKYGRTGAGGQSAICMHGGGTMVWPIIQGVGYLDLTPMPIEINLRDALSKQNIRVNTPATFTVGISTEPTIMTLAAERLLGLSGNDVKTLAGDIIYGQMRDVIATMSIEDINADREQLIKNISDSVEVELRKVGLRLINVNIQDITDQSGYLDALGREAAARAINEAEIKVAQQQRDGAKGVALADQDRRVAVAEAEAAAVKGEKDADREKRIAVAEAEAAAVKGEKDADQRQRVAVAAAEATATEGENLSQITIADSNSDRREKESEALRKATAAERVNSARAEEESFAAEAVAEQARAERDEASRRADEIVPATIERERIETLAAADAEKIRLVQAGEADGQFAKLEAEAKGVRANLQARADGIKQIVEAAGGSDAAGTMMMIEQAPQLVAEAVKLYENVNIDSVTVWDAQGGQSGEGSATSNWLNNAVGALPPLHSIAKTVGLRLPEFLGTLTEADVAAIAEGESAADDSDAEEADSEAAVGAAA